MTIEKEHVAARGSDELSKTEANIGAIAVWSAALADAALPPVRSRMPSVGDGIVRVRRIKRARIAMTMMTAPAIRSSFMLRTR
jgi:hypothetical protein